jgi:hypothetical protein
MYGGLLEDRGTRFLGADNSNQPTGDLDPSMVQPDSDFKASAERMKMLRDTYPGLFELAYQQKSSLGMGVEVDPILNAVIHDIVEDSTLTTKEQIAGALTKYYDVIDYLNTDPEGQQIVRDALAEAERKRQEAHQQQLAANKAKKQGKQHPGTQFLKLPKTA